MQIKFIFNNFILYGVSATVWQRASGIRRRRWRLWLAYPIIICWRKAELWRQRTLDHRMNIYPAASLVSSWNVSSVWNCYLPPPKQICFRRGSFAEDRSPPRLRACSAPQSSSWWSGEIAVPSRTPTLRRLLLGSHVGAQILSAPLISTRLTVSTHRVFVRR